MRSLRQFSFLNSPKKLVFVRMYESTISGVVGPPYPYCSLVVFCVFAILHAQKHLQAKINKQNKNKLTLNNKGNNFSIFRAYKLLKGIKSLILLLPTAYILAKRFNILALTLPFFLFVF